MKYKVGDKIKIVEATAGCYGANGKIGTVTNKHSTDGLCHDGDGFNVDCGNGHIWKIGFASECELLDELTAEEAIRIQSEMCSVPCRKCPISKERGAYECRTFRAEHPDKVLEILKQLKKEHEKKEVEVTQKIYCLVVDEERKVVHEEEISNSDSCMDVLKNYCENHDGKFFSLMEFRYEVKQ